MKVLKQGAEAVIYKQKIDGRSFLVKERVEKRYRLSQIDEKLRSNRMRQEMKLMREARGNGVLTPKLVSSEEKSYKIVMEDLGDQLVKDFLEKKFSEKLCSDIGTNIGKLHSAGIVHGDLTTSNMILNDGRLYFIDFGLGQFSKRIEDMAIDLSVLSEAIRATHNKIYEKCWKAVEKGYRSGNGRAEEVLQRMQKIEKRGRYNERQD